MHQSDPAPQTVRFGDFVLDLANCELRRDGHRVRLERLPMNLLMLLVERRPRLVTRGEIADRLWGEGVFVDAETGIHTAVRKVRQALRDPAEAPLFVETVPGRGYRFVAAVDEAPPPPAGSVPSGEPVAGGEPPRGDGAPAPERPRRPSTAALVATALAAIAVLAVLAALWVIRSSPPRGPTAAVTLAVLPFQNSSGDASREYLAEGLAEEVIAALGQIDPERFDVIGRTSTLAYRGSSKSIAEIGRELDADYLVEGSLHAEQGVLRITTGLVRVADQVQVWSASYDREPVSVLDLQRELSRAIAQQIRLQLPDDRLDALARRQTRNAEAYDLYLRGRYLWNQLTPEANRGALGYFERAIELDPDYALAWSGVADVLLGSPINSDVPPLGVAARARQAAERAVAAEPTLAETQTSLGGVEFFLEWDWPAAEAALRRAVDLDPSYARAHQLLAHVLSQTGRHEEAQRSIERARELDPLFAMNHAMASQLAFQRRDHQAALGHARQALVIEPGFWIAHLLLAQAHEQLGEVERALAALDGAGRFSGGNSKVLSFRGHLLATSGRPEEAREVADTLAALSVERYLPPYGVALVEAGLGDADAAFRWLERAFEARDVHLVFLTVDPRWDTLRSDPRFDDLLGRCGFTSHASGESRRR